MQQLSFLTEPDSSEFGFAIERESTPTALAASAASCVLNHGARLPFKKEPVESDAQNHSRKVLMTNASYPQKRVDHTQPTYQPKGWPIGSGITESGVKGFGK
jgi:hypothetical protein